MYTCRMQEASLTLNAFHSMYFLPGTSSGASAGGASPQALLAAPLQAPPDPASANRMASKRPVPGCAAPLNDASVLPKGFSTTPAVPNAAVTSPATGEAPGDEPGGPPEQPGPTGAPTSSAAVAAGGSTSVPVRRASQAQGPSAPPGAQTISQQDIAAVHAWLAEKVNLAMVRACVSRGKVCFRAELRATEESV